MARVPSVVLHIRLRPALTAHGPSSYEAHEQRSPAEPAEGSVAHTANQNEALCQACHRPCEGRPIPISQGSWEGKTGTNRVIGTPRT